MSGISKSRRPRKGKKGRAGPPDPQVPHERFVPILQRLNQLGHYYHRVWPDGVSPKSLFEKHVDPVIRWYNSGERGEVVFRRMKALRKLLDIPSLPYPEDDHDARSFRDHLL